MLSTRTPFLWTCPFPFVYITASFMAGIATAYHLEIFPLYLARLAFISLSLLYIGIVVWGHKRGEYFVGMGLLGLSCIFLAGYLSTLHTKPKYDAYHLLHHAHAIEAYQAVVIASTKVKKRGSQTAIKLKKGRIQGVWQPVTGKVMLRWPNEAYVGLKYGDVVMVHGKPKRLSAWLQENLFDYTSFLAQQNIHHTHLIHPRDIRVVAHTPPSLLIHWALHAQKWLATHLRAHLPNAQVRGIVLALLLGMRDELDTDVQKTYIGAGIIHVLAVSGLHVGLLYLLLLALLFLLGLKRKQPTTHAITVAILWIYACITGLSPSLIRAVTMFTLLATSHLLKRKPHTINTLAISAFLLMLYHPLVLFQLGFQLSYTAVLGILWWQPTLYQLLPVSSPWLKKAWTFTTVSLAAQLATLPLTLYHFHTFPLYFLLANALILPLAPLIMIMAFAILLTTPLPMLSTLLGQTLTHLITLLNACIKLIYTLPGSQITHVYPSLTATCSLYALLICLWLFIHYRNYTYLIGSTCFALLIATLSVYTWAHPREKWVFYTDGHHTSILFVHQHTASPLLKHPAHTKAYHSLILPHLKQKGIAKINTPSAHSSYYKGLQLIAIQGKKAMCLATPTCLPQLTPSIALDFLLVANNAIKDITPLLAHYNINLLIIAPNNRTHIRKNLQQQARVHHLKHLVLPPNTLYAITIP